MSLDVVVVGGGPAGAVTAGLLAGQGMRTRLVDAARFPRPKPCGESLNPGAVALLHRLGLWGSIRPLQPAPLSGWRLRTGSHACDLTYPAGQQGAAVSRSALDCALLKWAAHQGADVVEGLRVTDLLWDGRRVAGVIARSASTATKMPASLVIGADGVRSVVARRLGLTVRTPTSPRVALTAHWTGIRDLGDRGELHFCGNRLCGLAPLGRDEANLVLVLPADTGARAQEPYIWPALAIRLEGARPLERPHVTGLIRQTASALWAPGALLVGDAAGYFDPLTGQGIYRALRGAELAAAAVLDGRAEALAAYERAVRREFQAGLRLQRVLDQVVRRPALFSPAVGLLSRTRPLQGWLMERVGDCPRLPRKER